MAKQSHYDTMTDSVMVTVRNSDIMITVTTPLSSSIS